MSEKRILATDEAGMRSGRKEEIAEKGGRSKKRFDWPTNTGIQGSRVPGNGPQSMKKMSSEDEIVQENRRKVSRKGCIREMNGGCSNMELRGVENEDI